MGGKAFGDTCQMDHQTFWDVALTASDEIRGHVGQFKFHVVGSASPLRNDVDMLVAGPFELYRAIVTLSVWGGNIKKITSYTHSIRYPMGGKFYQLDLIHSKDMEYSKFAYMPARNSKYKGVHRNIMMASVVKMVSVQTNGHLRSRKHLDLYDGLTELEQSNEGKNGPLARYRTFRKHVITTNINHIKDQFFDPRNPLDSFEAVFDLVISNGFQHSSKSIEILQDAFDTMLSHGIEIPFELAGILNTT